MAKQYSAYIKDEDDIDWIEDVTGDVFDSENQLFRKAVKVLRQEKGEEIKALMTEDEDRTIL